MRPARINTKQQLAVLVTRLNEFEKRASRLAEAGEAPTAPSGQAPPASSKAPAPAQVGQDDAPAAKDPITVASIIDQLNAVRGGRSFKEENVKAELQRYFDGLDDAEQEALHAYLKGLAQIVSGQVDAGAAEEPSNHGVSTASSGKKIRTIKPNVIRRAPQKVETPAVVKPAMAPSKEDTSPPMPIVPKKR